jgi:hypothetical protein
MLKNGRAFGQDYFDELLERIREIRASERRAHQKITDVFEQCSSDYRRDSEETEFFFKIVQNHLHFATTGKTTAELIHERADAGNPPVRFDEGRERQIAPLSCRSCLLYLRKPPPRNASLTSHGPITSHTRHHGSPFSRHLFRNPLVATHTGPRQA